MINPDFYKAIFTRKSIRKYTSEPLESETLQSVKMFIDQLAPLYAGIKTEIVILSANEVKTLFPMNAPHYIAFYSETSDGYLQNAGFMLQQMDLFFSANGIGSCWLGLSSPKKESARRNCLEFIIAMAFGNAAEPLCRTSISEFNRKSMSEISSVSGADELLEAARVSPSASNTQPWYFSGSDGTIVISRRIPNGLKAMLYKKYNRIDMGIALCHLQIAALHFGKTIKIDRENTIVPKEFEYFTTVTIR
jgi:nitroreductase